MEYIRDENANQEEETELGAVKLLKMCLSG